MPCGRIAVAFSVFLSVTQRILSARVAEEGSGERGDVRSQGASKNRVSIVETNQHGDGYVQDDLQDKEADYSLKGCREVDLGGKMLYHGTLSKAFTWNFTADPLKWMLSLWSPETRPSVPFAPTWFTDMPPPKDGTDLSGNPLPYHVPMMKLAMYSDVAQGATRPLYLKALQLKAKVKVLDCPDAASFYSDLENEPGGAARFCAHESYAGYRLEKDANTRRPEVVICNPSASLRPISSTQAGTIKVKQKGLEPCTVLVRKGRRKVTQKQQLARPAIATLTLLGDKEPTFESNDWPFQPGMFYSLRKLGTSQNESASDSVSTIDSESALP
eukprot:TRINITY_DN41150_c0_g1_i1.p1 TRINITY_DN41150_c0_g1~~TRINITY_DN41150_c0_g1_i1.p1  ORF type:complete len:349 (-),score=48.80 TRINITY_DN41150_c0_g1_i1:288-1274(-)